MSVIYPEYLPCPTWSYGDGTELFLNRTGYECGWTRQRKNIQDNYIQYSLSFLMDTREFNRWQQWVSENGYNWFSIKLDRVAGELEEETIRFITPFTFSYNAYDIVAVTVDAEQYNGKPNPPRQPEVPPDGLPECQPYSCSAYEDYLDSLNIQWWKTYTTDQVVDLAYPFAATTGNSGVLFYYSNYLAGAGLVATWSGGGPGASSGSFAFKSTNPLDQDSEPDFCGGTIRQALCYDSEAPSANGCLARGSPSVLCEWGDHAIEAVICGYNGSNNISARSATPGNRAFVRGSGKRWRFTRDGTTVTQGDPDTVEVAVGTITATNDIRVVMYIGGNSSAGYPDATTTFDISDVADKFSQISVGISSTSPFEIQISEGVNAGKYAVARDVTIECNYAGTSQAVTARQIYSSAYTNDPKSITNLQEMPLTFSTYTQPIALWQATMSIVSFSWGTGPIDVSGLSQISYDRNFVEYTPPGYCSP